MSIWFGAWLSVTLSASLANIGAWVWQTDGVVRVVSNIAWLFGLPGWVPLYLLGISGARRDPGWIIAANGSAWAFWFIGLWLLLQCREHATRPAEPSPSSKPSSKPSNPTRRAFLANTGAGAITGGFIGAPLYGAAIEPARITTPRYRVSIDGLPPGLDGLRIVQFADTHLGPRVPSRFVERAVEIAIGLRPDLIVLNGDYVHDGLEEIERSAELMRPLVASARFGAIGVLGNHDWWADGVRMSAALSAIGVRMIDNTRLWLDPALGLTDSPTPGSLVFAGLGDLDEDTVEIDSALAGLPAEQPRILVAHQPDTAELPGLASEGSPRVDLMLAGHTHGGQVRVPLLGTPIVPSRFGDKYAGGLVDAPRFPVLVSRGIGVSLLQVRIGVPPEIPLVTLSAR